MFRYFILPAIFSFLFHAASGQLQWVSPKPSGAAISKIIFTDAQQGFVFNADGDLARTQNRGTTWEVIHNFFGTKVFNIHDSTAVVAGYNLLYTSSDNGNTWQKRAGFFPDNYVGIDIIGRDTIILAGVHKLYKSFNRGQTWQVIDLGNITIYIFDFVTANIGFVGQSNTSLLKTTNGGQTWQPMLATGYGATGFTAIKFLNADTGYTYRQTDTLYKTTNGGTTWQGYHMGADDMYDIHFPTPLVGYAVGGYGLVSRTTDGGTTWNYLSSIGLNTINYTVYFLSADTGFVAGAYGKIIKTTDGGQTWQLNAFTYKPITALAFPGTGTGYATTWNNIYKTTDTTKTWNPLPLTVGTQYASNSRFQNAQFFSADTGFVTASYPARVFKTNNGGQTWRTINLPYMYGTFYDDNPGISFINDSTGFISLFTTGAYALYKTKDRGENWRKIDSSRVYNETYNKIYFLNEKTGYALRNYTLYKTNDSARTWNLIYTNQDAYTINCMYFIDARTGFIGDNYRLRRTSDSGRTWTIIDNYYYNDHSIAAINFENGSTGYLTTTSGSIYQTQDSGRTWSVYGRSINYDYYASIAFSKEPRVYVAGAYGSMVSLPVDTSYGTTSGSCQGGSFTFISDVQGDSYQWQVDTGTGFINIYDDGIYSGTANYQLIINNTTPAWATYKYRCKITNTVYSKIHSFQFNKAQWTGAIDSVWEKPGNWSCSVLPDSKTDVVITNGPVVLHSNVVVRSLRLSPGVVFTVDTGYTLTVTH